MRKLIRKIPNQTIRIIVAFPIFLLYSLVEVIYQKRKMVSKIGVAFFIIVSFYVIFSKVNGVEARKPSVDMISGEAKITTIQLQLQEEEVKSSNLLLEEPMVQKISSCEEKGIQGSKVSKQVARKEETDMSVSGDLTEEFLLKAEAFAEAGIDNVEGMKAVIHVIHNRTRSNQEDYGSTVYEVISKPGAFSSFVEGRPCIVMDGGQTILPITEEMLEQYPEVEIAYQEAMQEISKGIDPTQEKLRETAIRNGITDPKYWQEGALYFYNPMYTKGREASIREQIKVKEMIGRQYFYCYWD